MTLGRRLVPEDLVPGLQHALRHRVARIALLTLAILTLVGWGNGPKLKDIRFDVTEVTLNGPNTINGGGSANYTVGITIKRTGAGQGDRIVGTGGDGVRIRPSLFQDNTQLTFREIDFAPNENSKTVTLTLSCRNGEVVGSTHGTGHGHRVTFLWWSWDDPAHVKAHLNETESGIKNVMCN